MLPCCPGRTGGWPWCLPSERLRTRRALTAPSAGCEHPDRGAQPGCCRRETTPTGPARTGRTRRRRSSWPMGARRMRKRTHHRPDEGPIEAAPAPVPAVLGDGPNGACGVVPPPFPAGVALKLCFRAATAACAAGTSGAAVSPNEEMFATEFAKVRPNARSPATTFARFAAVGDAVDAAAGEDGAWSAADRDAGVEDARARSVTAGVTPSAIVVPGAAAGIGGGLLSPASAWSGPAVVCVAP